MPARGHRPRPVPRLSRERRRDEPNPIEKIIGDAVRTASNWQRREALAAVLRYLAALDGGHWREDAAARLVAGAVENDHV